MNDSVFVDTNILVYAHTDLDIRKQSIAQSLIVDHVSYISTQVLQELANVLRRKFKHPWKDIESVLLNASENMDVHTNNEKTILASFRIAEHHGFSFYDSMIISAALECRCKTLYSEDLHHGQIIEKDLKIVNPFN